MEEYGLADQEKYFKLIINNKYEFHNFIYSISINVSWFFREPLKYEILNNIILPQIIYKKKEKKKNTIRIWSAGCSVGQEPYSIAILLRELLVSENNIKINIFASDIDKKSLKQAEKANYNYDNIKSVKLELLDKYFTKTGSYYRLIPEIKKYVIFCFFNMLNNNYYVPKESIFGDFDLVLCNNLLMYYNQKSQNLILNKIYRSLKPGGFLLTSSSDGLNEDYKAYFKDVFPGQKIYEKIK